jgi:hypothetical protein
VPRTGAPASPQPWYDLPLPSPSNSYRVVPIHVGWQTLVGRELLVGVARGSESAPHRGYNVVLCSSRLGDFDPTHGVPASV